MDNQTPIRLYGFRLSGHAHRAELALSVLGLRYEKIEVDLAKGQHKTPEFIAMNSFGQVPVIDDNGVVVADSNAILVYLALRHDPARRWYPDDAKTAAEIQRWLSVAAGLLQTGPGSARLVGIFNAKHDLARAQANAATLFAVMEREVSGDRAFLVTDHPTIADLALYSYVALAPEGYISHEPYPAIEAWLARIEALDGFVPMSRTVPRFGLPEGAEG